MAANLKDVLLNSALLPFMYFIDNSKFNVLFDIGKMQSTTFAGMLKTTEDSIAELQEFAKLGNDEIKGVKMKVLLNSLPAAEEIFTKVDKLIELAEENEISLWAAKKCVNYAFNYKALFIFFGAICIQGIEETAADFCDNYHKELEMDGFKGKFHEFTKTFSTPMGEDRFDSALTAHNITDMNVNYYGEYDA